MKFFTLDWWAGAQDTNSPRPEVEPGVAYSEYLATIKDKLPEAFRSVNAESSLHDGRVRTFDVQVGRSESTVVLDADDGTGGHRVYTLSFRGVRRLKMTAEPEKGLPGPLGFGDLGYWETDVGTEGELVFRALFSSGIVAEVEFAEFAMTFVDKDL